MLRTLFLGVAGIFSSRSFSEMLRVAPHLLTVPGSVRVRDLCRAHMRFVLFVAWKVLI